MRWPASVITGRARRAKKRRSANGYASSGKAEHAVLAELLDQRRQVAEQSVPAIEQLIHRLRIEQRTVRGQARGVLRIALELAREALARESTQRLDERARVALRLLHGLEHGPLQRLADARGEGRVVVAHVQHLARRVAAQIAAAPAIPISDQP